MSGGQTCRSRALSISAGDPHQVYRCYDADNRLLYVGCTSNLKRRITQHQHATSRSTLASRVLSVCMTRVEVGHTYPDRDTAQRAEADAIHDDRPLLNHQKAWVPGWRIELAIVDYLAGQGIAAESVGLSACLYCGQLRPYRARGYICGDCHDPEFRAYIDSEQRASRSTP